MDREGLVAVMRDDATEVSTRNLQLNCHADVGQFEPKEKVEISTERLICNKKRPPKNYEPLATQTGGGAFVGVIQELAKTAPPRLSFYVLV